MNVAHVVPRDVRVPASSYVTPVEESFRWLGWWPERLSRRGSPASLLLAFIGPLDARKRKLLLPAVIGMVFTIAGLCLIRVFSKNDFKIGWPAVHGHRSARRRAVLIRWGLDWITRNGVALFLFLFLPLIVDLPGPLASNPPGQPTGTRVAVAAAIGALWAPFKSFSPKSGRILDEIAAELTANKAGVDAGAVSVLGGEDTRPDVKHGQAARSAPEQRAGRLSSKSSRVLH
jgi:hypothetical protein